MHRQTWVLVREACALLPEGKSQEARISGKEERSLECLQHLPVTLLLKSYHLGTTHCQPELDRYQYHRREAAPELISCQSSVPSHPHRAGRCLQVGTFSLAPACDMDCQTRCLIDCSKGYYYTAGNCVECPVGFYCTGGRVAPQKCPAGTANELTGQADVMACQACPDGYVSLDTRAGCRACPGGYSCDPHSGLQTSCSPGQYSPEGEQKCRECPQGYICPEGHNRQHCPAGQEPNPSHVRCVACAPGSFSTEGAVRCQPCPAGTGLCLKCPAGYFCPAGATYPRPCQPGTYNPLPGQDEATDCRPCPAGRACTQAALTQPDSECMVGHVCPLGSSSPHAPSNACPPGTFTNYLHLFDKSQCETCPARFICTRGTGGKQKPPAPCPVGHYCPPGTKYPTQYKCASGTWSNRTGLASEGECLPCPAGWFCMAGVSVPSGRCRAGHYCPEGTRTSTQLPCPAGTYSTRMGNGRVEDCAACPAGSYCGDGTAKPVVCPMGTFRAEQGAKAAEDCEHTSREAMLLVMVCPAGLLCPEGQAVAPDASGNACPRGYYCPQGDLDFPARPCPNGTYGEQQGLGRADECLPCPAGKYCYREGTTLQGITHPTGDCPPGYTCPPGTGFPFSFPCQPSFCWDNSTGDGGDACRTCPAGHYCDSPAMTEPKPCPAGSYCVQGSSHPEPCPEGTYSNRKGLAGPLECNPCGGGFFCAEQGQTGPSGHCEAGFYCWGRALTPLPTDGVTGNLCPAGAYCPPGSPLPIPCPAGTYSNASGLSSLKQCLDCPPGLYCDGTNSQAPTGPCKPGYFCTGAAKTALQQVAMEGHYTLAGAFRPEPCPLGSFQPGRGRSLCRECPEGTFCNQTGLAEPVACPMGHYCPAGSTLPLPCPVGTYGTGSCTPCTPGMYCSMAGLARPEGLCQPGYYCVQGSSSPSPVGRPFGDLCPPGYYCFAGTKSPNETPCPAGTWNEHRGAQDASWCLPCPSGFFCNVTGQVSPAGFCAPGYYCTGRTRTPRPMDGITGNMCPEGHYCPAGSRAPSPCPDGEHSNTTGQEKCSPCPAGFHCQSGIKLRCPPGFYCPQKTGISFSPCPPGTYNPSHGVSQAERCQQCPAGMFCGEWGLSSPSGPCWPGFFCTAGASVPNPNGVTNTSSGGPCPPGHFCPAGTSMPLPCPVGTYSDRLYLGLESSCTPCPPGYHCSSAGLVSPSGPCSAGFYCLSGASSPSPAGIRQKGGPCPLSHFCPEGTSFPFPCLAGTYNNLTQQAACFPCAAGYYCPENTTSYSVYPCPPGFYCPTGTKFATEFPCPRGYYNPDPMTQSLDSCLPCPPGHYCRKENLTAVSGKCDAGWFCVSAAWTSQPFDVDNYTNSNCLCPATATGGKCMAGFYCPEGSPEPIPCPPGFYCSASGLSVPSGECAAGFYCTGGAASPKPTDGVTGNICPPGTYCNPGSAMPVLCPAGTFCGLQGQSMVSECQPCLSGFYCAVPGLSAPSGECWEGYYCDSSQGPVSNFTLYPCPQGFYCPAGTQQATQHSCPPGTFGPRQRLKSMAECQGCPPGKYCALPGLAAPTGDCSEGFWCKGGAQVKDPIDGESGLPCPPGRYCLAGTPIPLLCPRGTWSSSKGNKNLQDCQPCSGGHYCNGTGLVAPSGYCSPGFYCISGAQTPTPTDASSGAPCPVGHYCPLGTESPIPCPSGSYMPQTHGKECYDCPEGKYCVPGQEPQSCPKGYYCPRGTGLDWWPCPRGTYSPEQGLDSSTGCRVCDGGKFCSHRNATNVAGECWEGFYCTKGSDRPNPHTRFQGQAGPCPPGHYCPRGTAVPEPCPVGTFSTRIKLSSEAHCSPCLPGHYCNSTGLLVPTGQCAEGFYCTLGSTLPVVPAVDKTGGPCPTGYFCPRGTATPLPCPAGSYNPSERQASCLPCTKGFFCPKNSSSLERNECPAGHFCPLGTASATQFPCPRGTYNPQTGSSHISHCIPCDPGHYCALAGQSHMTGPCSAGYYCSAGVSTSTPADGLVGNVCPKGNYCPMGSVLPRPCPLGYYSNSTGNMEIEDCLLCDAGYFCNRTGLSSPTGLCGAGFYCSGGAVSPQSPMTTSSGGPCPPGHYCVVGSSRAQPCPAGSYSPFWGMAQCFKCPEGFYCKAGSTNYTACPTGHYCPKNTEFGTQFPCPRGTYSDAFNIWDASKCQLCPPGKVCSKPGLTSPDALCMPGWFCPPGSTSTKPVFPGSFPAEAGAAASGSLGLCQAGTFCPGGSAIPIPCTPGWYCASPELAAPSGPCDAGFYCTGGSTLPNPMDGAVGNICPRGHFCPQGSSSPSPCPPGSFLAQRGGQSAQDCQLCLAGWFCSLRGQSSPEGLCKEGWFCPLGSASGRSPDHVCPAGHYCPAGSPEPKPCPAGKYQDQTGQSQCKTCPAGKFCGQKDQTQDHKDTSSHGLAKPADCPAGYYCPSGTKAARQYPCPEGTFSNQTGLQSSHECQPCPAGKFCANAGLSAPSGPCSPGHYCTLKAHIPNPMHDETGDLCPAGHFCPLGSSSPVLCPTGTFLPQTGMASRNACLPCLGGKFCQGEGMADVSGTCHAGYYCPLGSTKPDQELCPTGFYCPKGSELPVPCDSGSLNPHAGRWHPTDCQLCPAGHFCSGFGRPAPEGPCSAGFYCPPGQTSAIPASYRCPQDYYCPAGSAMPVPCERGTYQPQEGKDSCDLCPAGLFCEPSNKSSGVQLPRPCPVGYFCPPGTSFSTEHPCPRGTFGPKPGATHESDCEPCPAGMYCSAPGLTQPSGFCHSGYYCTKGAITPAPIRHRVESVGLSPPGNDICPPGHFCPNGTSYPIPCPPGSYSSSLGLAAEDQCQLCPAGRYCNRAGLSDLSQASLCSAGYVCLEGSSGPCPSNGLHGYRCPSGFYCPTGTGLEIPCEPGMFSPMPGASVCLPCPAGVTCRHAATVKPLSCPQGYYCPSQTAMPLPCPEGTLNTLEGALSPAACRPCPVGRYCRGHANWEPDGLCSAGYYCAGGAADAVPRRTPGFPLNGPCPLGHYCPEGTLFPVACPVGTLNNSTGCSSQDSCVPCYPGFFCASVGLSSPTGPCAAGFYCPANFSSFSPTAFLCPKGHFCTSGAAYPTSCPTGEYQPHRGSESCIPCQPGFYCQETVSGDPKHCPPHTYCPAGTLVPYPCPDGTFTPPNKTGLQDERECLACSAGHYCRGGWLEGKCAAGYFCQARSFESTPQGHDFPWSSLAECPWGQVCAGLCPAGFYCQEGSEVPTPCPPNTIRAVPGASQREDCLPCPPGRWCQAGDPVSYLCPSGHYCTGGNITGPSSVMVPQQCPEHTYYPGLEAQSLADCQPCPPGYRCPMPGLTTFEDYPCPPGHWCPGEGDTFLCPPGTFRTQPGAVSLDECDPCSPGYYCPDPAQTKMPNIQGTPCEPGYECPPGSVNPIICRPGFYCGLHTGLPSMCPGGYYCPEGSSRYNTPEQLCVFPYYCPPGSMHPLPCKGGYMACNVTGPRDSFETCCRLCDAGTYRSDFLATPSCQPCPAGFTCPPGSSNYLQQPCPRGYYCPPMAHAPVPCPPGTHGNSSLAKHPDECHACPAGSFNHLRAQTGCFPCGSSSSSQPGATSCSCHGLNRAFQQSDGSCICQAGYVYYDERGKKSSDSNSDQDCQSQVEERCAPGEVRLASTRQCVSPEQHDCSPFCGPVGGKLNAELGMCHCEQYVSAEELCDRECLLRAPQISLRVGINRELLLSVEEGEDREVTGILGPDEHVQRSQRVHFVLFSPGGVLGVMISSTEELNEFLTASGGFGLATPLQKGWHSKAIPAKDPHRLPHIPNPIVCVHVGDTILFQLSIHPHDRASSHYPVYQKQHLYNSNPSWDFGPFRRLDHLIRETHLNISKFAHVFPDPGRYVFRDNTVQDRTLIVTVNEENMGCDPKDSSFQPSSPYQLARHGILKHRKLNLAPNWAAVTAVLFVLGFLIFMLLTLAIVLRPPISNPSPMKSWKPRWRSLGEPHIPPEYVLIKDSLQFYEALGPHGSGEGADTGEKAIIYGAGEQHALRNLEDFSVRTLYDKLEDQNLHLASQLTKHRTEVMAFYRGISQRIQDLADMAQALNSEGLKVLTKQSVPVDKTQSTTQGATVGAEWREATELMKALKILLGQVRCGNVAVKTEVTQQLLGQDRMATQGKAETEQGQDPALSLQHGLSSRKGAFAGLPGYEEQGLGLQPGSATLACLTELEVESLMATSPLAKTLQEIKQALEKHQQLKQRPSPPAAPEAGLHESSPGLTGNALVPMDLASLSPRQFVVYRFGCAMVRLLSKACFHPALVLMLAQAIPDQDLAGTEEDFQSPGAFYYDAINRLLYLHPAELENVGAFIATLLNALARIKTGSTSAAAPGSCFQRELNRAIMALANAFFQSSWGAAEKDPIEDNSSTLLDCRTIFEELLRVQMSPDPCCHEKSQRERLQHYQCFQLRAEILDSVENLGREEAGKRSENTGKKNADSLHLQVAKLEDKLDELNEEFLQLTVQALASQKEGELLDQELRAQEELLTQKAWDTPGETTQHYTRLLEAWATKRDQTQLLEIRRSCLAQRISDTESELFHLQQTTVATGFEGIWRLFLPENISRLFPDMFITVLFGAVENEQALFNINCKVQPLLESMKHCCGCESEGEIELADESGQVKNLLQNQHGYASELLHERELCVLLSVARSDGSAEAVFTPLLKHEGIINPKFLAKLGNWEDSKVPSARARSRKASRKPTLHLEIPAADGKRTQSPQGNRNKMVSPSKQGKKL
ncbi:hypothetical protein Y1Q_0022586 [Alligator mississippiensis]|uniref:Tyrosine-protein kinase ephrin type A/B receptor-like domain-containing protein n=1 Tax=Alligator mississippiensis TaxID=8496 RepID=A0A151NQ85_ALLMI|nr:hypothetical protein Y1Q_0022586 [Alligator mississippiensis]